MQWNNGHGCWMLHVNQTCPGRDVSKLAAGLGHRNAYLFDRLWPNLSVLIQALESHMESRHRQRQLNLQHATAIEGISQSSDQCRPWDWDRTGPRTPFRTVLRGSPGVQASRLWPAYHICRGAFASTQGQGPNQSPARTNKPQTSNGRRVPLQLSWPGQPCTSPTTSWDAAATRTPERPDRAGSEQDRFQRHQSIEQTVTKEFSV